MNLNCKLPEGCRLGPDWIYGCSDAPQATFLPFPETRYSAPGPFFIVIFSQLISLKVQSPTTTWAVDLTDIFLPRPAVRPSPPGRRNYRIISRLHIVIQGALINIKEAECINNFRWCTSIYGLIQCNFQFAACVILSQPFLLRVNTRGFIRQIKILYVLIVRIIDALRRTIRRFHHVYRKQYRPKFVSKCCFRLKTKIMTHFQAKKSCMYNICCWSKPNVCAVCCFSLFNGTKILRTKNWGTNLLEAT